MKHIIVEGCDGSGKTGLIGVLAEYFDLARHPRASDSMTGPVKNLRGWVDRDLDHLDELELDSGHPTYIYDRHPLISEPIYANYRWVNQGMAEGFGDENWMRSVTKDMGSMSILIICCPPYEEVERVLQTQGREAHMPGVFENRYSIWTRYNTLRWPGTVIRYDRTRETRQDLIKTLENM